MRNLTPREEYELLEGRRAQMDQAYRAERIADRQEELRELDETIAAWADMVATAERRRARVMEELTAMGVKTGDLT